MDKSQIVNNSNDKLCSLCLIIFYDCYICTDANSFARKPTTEADDRFVSNIYARYRFGDDYRTTVYAGINNLFDDYGTFLPSNFNSGSTANLKGPQNDPIGRQFYVGLRSRF